MATDIGVRFGAVDAEDGGKEPAMGLYNQRQQRAAMYAIPLSSAYKYADQGYLLRASFAIAQYLGMFPDRFLVDRIATTILDNLDSLIRHRPVGLDLEEGSVFGEGEIRIDGEVADQFEANTNGTVTR
jgi:hypothetical protein